MEFKKKKNSLHWYFFERKLNLQSKWQKYELENLTSHRGKEFSGLLARAKIFEKGVKMHMERIRIKFQNEWHLVVICSMKNRGKKCLKYSVTENKSSLFPILRWKQTRRYFHPLATLRNLQHPPCTGKHVYRRRPIESIFNYRQIAINGHRNVTWLAVIPAHGWTSNYFLWPTMLKSFKNWLKSLFS